LSHDQFNQLRLTKGQMYFNTSASGRFWGFSRKKTRKRTWLCVGIPPVWSALQTQ